MGSPTNEEARKGDENQVEVEFSSGFWMAKYECLQVEWDQEMDANQSSKEDYLGPVDNVTWDDASAYCEKLELKLRPRLGKGWTVRLPTEAEWEYACRAGTKTPFSFGTHCDWMGLNSDGSRPYPLDQRAIESIIVVGGRPSWRAGVSGDRVYSTPNRFGLHNMHGNVFEWCHDRYDELLKTGTNPVGTSPKKLRVIRGGSRLATFAKARSASRDKAKPTTTRPDLGFRVVIVPPGFPK